MLRITAVLAASALLTAAAPPKHPYPVTQVTVTAHDYQFDAPASVQAGVIRFTLVNKGPSVHHLMVVRLNGGHTLDDVKKAASTPGPIPDWFEMMGGPNASDPGGTSNATLVLEPGTYLLTCFVSSAKDPVPHMMKGMVKELTVTPETKPAKSSLAPADMTMKLANYSFTTTKDLTAGKHTLRVENDGPQPHEVEITQLAPGKTVQDLMGWLQTENGPPPAHFVGGVAPLSPGHANNVDLNLTAGNYVLLCFLPDAKDGAPHFVHGMVRAFTIR